MSLFFYTDLPISVLNLNTNRYFHDFWIDLGYKFYVFVQA